MQCGGCKNKRYHVALRLGSTATSIQSWCEASGSGNGVGWTPKKIFWRKQVACYRSAWRAEREKKNAHLLKTKFPVNYRTTCKNHLIFPGKIQAFLWWRSIVSLWRKRHFFKKRSKRWRSFPPTGCFWCFTIPNRQQELANLIARCRKLSLCWLVLADFQ